MEFTYQGKVVVEDLHTMVDKAKSLMEERIPKVQFVDTLKVTGVPQEIGSILNELLEHYRQLGGKVIVMVANDKLNEMLGRSMSFGAGIKLEVFDNRPDALKFVSRQVTD
ncbi:MAG: hypothetical protein ACI9KE_000678 [Polyangiales bacterium]|jgi:hypothetical protein